MKKWISLLLVLVMVFSLSGGLGISAFAEDLAENAVTEETADTEETSDEELVTEEPAAEELLKEEILEEKPVTEEPAAEALPEEETVEEESEDEEEETIDDSEKYVFSKSVRDGGTYVLAYEEDGIFYVVTNSDGVLCVSQLDRLTATAVDKTMLWTISNGPTDFAFGNNGYYLTAASGGIELVSREDNAWSYSGTYIDYTTVSDVSYIAVISGGQLSASGGDFGSTSGRVVLYRLESEIELRASGFYQSYSNELISDSNYTVFVSTDRHGSTEALQSVVSSAEGYVESVYGTSIDKTVHGGDLVDSGDVSYNGATGLEAVNMQYSEILEWMDPAGADNFYTYGHSHDQNVTENGANGFLDSAGLVGGNSGAVELSSWAYLWGINHFEMTYADLAADAANQFLSWVDSLGDEDHHVIIIVSHVPMHQRRGDNAGAAVWLNAINIAAENNDIIFLWGHNHTQSNGNDFSCEFVAPGGSIVPEGGNSTQINFTYALAGYTNKSAGDWNGSAITVSNDSIFVDHFKTANLSATPNTAFYDTRDIIRRDPVPVISVEYVARNNNTGEEYEDVSDAIMAAGSGETVELLKDCSDDFVMVTVGRTLDLSGKTLTADFVAGFSGSNLIDSSDHAGLLACSNVTLNKDNSQMPVKTVEGYKFLTITPSQSIVDQGNPDVLYLRTRPYFMSPAIGHQFFGDGMSDNGISIEARLTYTNSQGSSSNTFFSYNDTHASSVYNGGTPSVRFYVRFTGVSTLQNVKATTIIRSDTGVEFVCPELSFS